MVCKIPVKLLKRDDRGVPLGYTSVTTVLSPYSGLGGIDPLVVKAAAERGTRVHKYCEMHALDLLIVEPESDCRGYVESFIKWYDMMVVKPLYIEERIDDEELKLSGGIDLVCYLKGDELPSVVDIKTPVNISPTWQLQTAAYKMLIERELGINIGRRIALKLPRDGSVAKVVEYTKHEQDRDMYLKALEVYRYFNK